VLLIQSWIIRGAEVRDALRSNGYEPQVYRVDFEPALAAALPRSTYDVILLDTRSTGIARTHVETLMRDHGVRAPLVEIVAGRPLGEDVLAALSAIRN
jgi:FixJ family two-component response regulator